MNTHKLVIATRLAGPMDETLESSQTFSDTSVHKRVDTQDAALLGVQDANHNSNTPGLDCSSGTASLLAIPTELLPLIASHLGPGDFLALARCCKTLRRIFMSKASFDMWRTAEWKTPRLPFCPVGLSTPQYAALVFTNDCSLCYKSSPNSKLETTLRVRLCESCHESELINVWSIKNYEEERLICNLSLTIKAPTVPSTYARWGASDGTSPHCLRRDLEKLYQTRKEFFQSGDRAGLARWEQYNQFSVEEFDEFAEMLERFLIYPKLTARQKNQLEESMGYDDDDSWGEEPYSDGGEEPSDEEEYMEGEGDIDESEGSMDEDD